VADPLRVVIAEDHYLVREGTRHLLEDTGEVEVVAAVGTATELLDAVRRLHPAAVITDVRMPPGSGIDGIEAAHTIRELDPSIGVVVLTQHADEGYAFALLGKGAEGLAYLLKERVAEVEDLMRALRDVVAGRSAIDPRIVDALVQRRARAASSPLAMLTPRELDVLRQMAEGKTNPAIGEALHLSSSAIEKHVNAIFSKLDLAEEPQIHRRVTAVLAYLRDSGLTSDSRR
jgi:DNA-binding NarL/FixJ family response regulator